MALGEVCFHSPGGFISNPPAETQHLICMKGKESLLRSPFNLEEKEKKLSAQWISCFISKLFHYTLKSCFCGGHKWKCAQQREKKWYGVTKSIFKSRIFFILHNGYKNKHWDEKKSNILLLMFNKQRYALSKREKRTNRDKLNSINATTNNAQLKRNNCKDWLLVRQTSPMKTFFKVAKPFWSPCFPGRCC